MNVLKYLLLFIIVILNFQCQHSSAGKNLNLIADSVSLEYLHTHNTRQFGYLSQPEYFMPKEKQKYYKTLYQNLSKNLNSIYPKKHIFSKDEIDSISKITKHLNSILTQAYDSFEIDRRSLRLTYPRNNLAIIEITKSLSNANGVDFQNSLVSKLHQFYLLQIVEALSMINNDYVPMCNREIAVVNITQPSIYIKPGDRYIGDAFTSRYENYIIEDPILLNKRTKSKKQLIVENGQVKLNIIPEHKGLNEYQLNLKLITKDFDTIVLNKDFQFYAE